MIYHVYVLKSLRNGKRYVGFTSDLPRRLAEHKRGISRFTSQNAPWVLIDKEQYDDAKEAKKREQFLKSGQG